MASDPAARSRDLQSELEWSWRFRGEVLAVLTEHPSLLAGSSLAEAALALDHASLQDDLERATDYTCRLVLPAVTWALRVRRHHALRPFGDHIVLRMAKGPCDGEPGKILTRHDAAQRYLYAWASEDESRFVQWVVLDLVRLRCVWADPDRRATLAARPVALEGKSIGLALPIAELIRADVVLRALLARPSFGSTSEIKELLSRLEPLANYSDPELQQVAVRMLRSAYHSTLYVGGMPLQADGIG